MLHKRLKLSFLFLLGLYLTEIQAQESIVASGGNASGSNGTLSYSIGQVAYMTNTGTTAYVLEGVQQPYEISIITVTEQIQTINLTCTAYPNPTGDILQLEIGNYSTEHLYYKLYDLSGNILGDKKITENNTHIKMEHFMPGTYFLKIIDNNQEIRIFKIIKN